NGLPAGIGFSQGWRRRNRRSLHKAGRSITCRPPKRKNRSHTHSQTKTSWTERKLADVYGGADVEHRRGNFRVGDMLNCLLRFIEKHSRKYRELMSGG